MKKYIVPTFSQWLPLSVAIVIIYAFIYLIVQQYIRQSANEILAQIAIDATEKIDAGVTAVQVVKDMHPADMEKSLAPFIILYGAGGEPLAGSAFLHGKIPVPPQGVFDYAAQNGAYNISWQPEPNARSAILVQSCTIEGKNGYLLSGRSLREIEQRELLVRQQVTVGTFITLVATFIATFIGQIIKRRANISASTLA